MNPHAAEILVACGLITPAAAAAQTATAGSGFDPTAPDNQFVSNRPDSLPHSTKSETMVWSSDGMTIGVNFNDSRDAAPGPNRNYSGYSVSLDGGTSWYQFVPSPFATGHGTNFGDPILFYNQKLAKWFAGDLASGCGADGIGLWTSADAITWSVGACAHNGTGMGDDRESAWVDNNPASPFYGRMYVSFNNFGSSGALQVVHSDDGVSWTAPATLVGTFERQVQMTGTPDSGGLPYVFSMIEGGGGFNNRTNVMYVSLDGGVSWTRVVMGAPFAPPGNALCPSNPYFVNVTPNWRYMGIGQPGVGPNGVVHYVYGGAGYNAGDKGDIYYTRSTNYGATWSDPIVLNNDTYWGFNATQWMPSLSVTTTGVVTAYWYDRRWAGGGNSYQIFAIKSTDNGATWGSDFPLQDWLIPQPAQPDPNVQSCYQGDYNYSTSFGSTAYATWNDGRVDISGTNVQNVFFAKLP